MAMDSDPHSRHDIPMANQGSTLTELAQRGDLRTLDDRWLMAIDHPNGDQADMLEALATLAQSGRADRAATLGWSWLTVRKEECSVAESLALGRELLLCCGDSEEMRQEVVGLYKEAFADRSGFEALLAASGLAGGKSPRRALRTLEIGLGLTVGDYLVSRSDEEVARVEAISETTWDFTIKGKSGRQTLDADALALAWDTASANDFRVLLQARPEELAAMIESDPVSLIIGILQSRHGGKVDSDHLEQMLVPRFVPQSKWSAWWSKAKTGLRRCPNVIVEGRNPVVLTYHAQGQTLEEEVEPTWLKAASPAQRLAVIETYLREAKARRLVPKAAFVRRLHRELMQRVDVSRKGAPAEALTEALLIDRLAQGAQLPEDAERPGRAIVAASADPAALVSSIDDDRFFVPAVELVREALPEKWIDLYMSLLPVAPVDGCDAIATALDKAGRTADVVRIVGGLLADFGRHLDAICWLWRGPSVQALEPVPRRELLPRLLDHLAEATRSDRIPARTLRHTREIIRAALSAQDYRHYREIISGMEAGMASTIYRTVDRMEGLGQVVRSTLMKIVHETHPLLFVKTRIDPWLDDGLIFCTQAGMQKREGEISHLVHVKIPENAKAIGEAAAHGDLSENSEYKFALEERDLLQARLLAMQNELSQARLLTANDIRTDEISVGTRVALAAVDGSGRRTIQILGPWESDTEKGIYNYRAPMCMRLRGLKVGDVVTLELDGPETGWRIEAIENALDQVPRPQ
ncbi:MAG: GreA/GreB family elongation factor [Phycisphaerae bacterium]|nr:GreA/GreB family elongation factor [Phycisphaerae bacterium]